MGWIEIVVVVLVLFPWCQRKEKQKCYTSHVCFSIKKYIDFSPPDRCLGLSASVRSAGATGRGPACLRPPAARGARRPAGQARRLQHAKAGSAGAARELIAPTRLLLIQKSNPPRRPCHCLAAWAASCICMHVRLRELVALRRCHGVPCGPSAISS